MDRYRKKNITSWVSRILAILILMFALPFYFGYGNPIPFINPEYTAWDNMWLTIMPVMFFGLAFGLFFPKAGGYIISIFVGLGIIASLLFFHKFIWFMLIPFAVGILYLLVAYKTEHYTT